MKRMLLLVLCLFLTVVIAGCGSDTVSKGDDPSETDETVTKAEVPSETAEPIEVEGVLICFGSEYLTTEYNDTQKEALRKNLSTLGIQGNTKRVIHIVDKRTAEPDLVWTYVYEFEKTDDAIAFESNRSDYVKGIENGKCCRWGNIVVFGNAPEIDEIDKPIFD